MTSYIKPAVILFKRGNEANLPTLEEGEPAFTIDSFKFFIGSSAGNQQISGGSSGGGGGATALSALSDVTIVSPDGNDYFTYSSATSKWINSAPSAAQWAMRTGDTFTGSVVIRPVLGVDFPNLKLVAPGGIAATCMAYSTWTEAASGLKWVTGMTPISDFSLNEHRFVIRSYDQSGSKLNEVMHMKRTGEVGILTENPTAILDVSGSMVVRQGFRANTDGGSTIRYSSIFESAGNASMLYIDAPNNRVGVGCSPASTLHVQGTFGIEEQGGGRKFDTYFSAGVFNIDIRDGSGYEPLTLRSQMFTFSDGTNPFLGMGVGAIVFNDLQEDIDFRVESDSNASMISMDAGTNRVGIAGSAGSTLQVTGDFYNTGSANLGNTLHVSKSNECVGIGTSAPADKLHVLTNVAGAVRVSTFENESTNSSAQVRVHLFRGADVGTGFNRGSAFFTTGNNFGAADYEARPIRFYTGTVAGAATQRLEISANGTITVGATTSGGDLSGWINVQNGIQRNGTAYTNPDYAVEHYFNNGSIVQFANNPGAASYNGLLPLSQLESYLKENMHLPNRWKSTNLFDWADMAQMWSEELAIYITQLHNRLEKREAQIDDLEARLARLEQRI